MRNKIPNRRTETSAAILSQLEVAQMLHITRQAVHCAERRALKKIRERLQDDPLIREMFGRKR